MRFLFITAALLLFSCAMAKEENDKVPDDKPLTEVEAKEIVFSVEKELANEIDGAVKTINDVFGNPACSNKAKRHILWGVGRKRATGDLKLEKRGWGGVWEAVTAAAEIYDAVQDGKRSEPESELNEQKRGWRKVFKGGSPGGLIGKRSVPESEWKVEKRENDIDKVVRIVNTVSRFSKLFGKRSEPESEWKVEKRENDIDKVVRIINAVNRFSKLFGKRSEPESESKMEKRQNDIDKVVEIINAVKTISDLFGKRSEPESELKADKRGWGKPSKGVSLGGLIGKRSEAESESKVEKRQSDIRKVVDIINVARTLSGLFGKRSSPENELKLEKRNDWQTLLHEKSRSVPIFVPSFIGKRSEPVNELKDEKPGPNSKESDNRNDSDDSPEAENEFRADIAKLERGLEVLNDVLLIAKATAESE